VNYTIDISNAYNESNLILYYNLSGFDMDSYILNVTRVEVPVTERETNTPNISLAELVAVNRSQAKFLITSDSLGFLYFVYADMHMPQPLFQDVRYSTPNTTLNYSNNIYDVAYVKTIPAQTEFTISDLRPGHDYEIFIFIMNMNKLYNSNLLNKRYAKNCNNDLKNWSQHNNDRFNKFICHKTCTNGFY